MNEINIEITYLEDIKRGNKTMKADLIGVNMPTISL